MQLQADKLSVLCVFQIDDVLGHPTSSRKPTLEDSRRLPYVEATILEVMRIETVVPQSVPRKTLGDATVNGFFVPKGTMVSKIRNSEHMVSFQ